MQVECVGYDPTDYGRLQKRLMVELQKAGFKRNELRYTEEISEDGSHHVLLFGSEALKQYTEHDRMSDVRGQLITCAWNDRALIIPTFSPGFLIRNPDKYLVFNQDLQTARVWFALDQDGVVV